MNPVIASTVLRYAESIIRRSEIGGIFLMGQHTLARVASEVYEIFSITHHSIPFVWTSSLKMSKRLYNPYKMSTVPRSNRSFYCLALHKCFLYTFLPALVSLLKNPRKPAKNRWFSSLLNRAQWMRSFHNQGLPNCRVPVMFPRMRGAIKVTAKP